MKAGSAIRVSLPLLIAAAATMGCDPTWAVSIDNQSDQTVLVGRIYHVDDEPRFDVLVAEPHARTTIGTYGVASQVQVEQAVLMSETCDVLANQPISETFYEGGVIVVGRDQSIDFNGGGNPPGGVEAATSRDCIDTVQALVPPSP